MKSDNKIKRQLKRLAKKEKEENDEPTQKVLKSLKEVSTQTDPVEIDIYTADSSFTFVSKF